MHLHELYLMYTRVVVDIVMQCIIPKVERLVLTNCIQTSTAVFISLVRNNPDLFS